MYGCQGQTLLSRDCGSSLAICFRRSIASIESGGSCVVIRELIGLYALAIRDCGDVIRDCGECHLAHLAVATRDFGLSYSRHDANYLALELLRIELKHRAAKDGTITTVWALLCVCDSGREQEQ